MEYIASEAPIQYASSLVFILGTILGIFLLLMIKAPPKYCIRKWVPIAFVIALSFSSIPVYILYSNTTDCLGILPNNRSKSIAGELEVTMHTAKNIWFKIGDKEFSTAPSGALSECGIRASLGQSVKLQSGSLVEAKEFSGKITKFKIIGISSRPSSILGESSCERKKPKNDH